MWLGTSVSPCGPPSVAVQIGWAATLDVSYRRAVYHLRKSTANPRRGHFRAIGRVSSSSFTGLGRGARPVGRFAPRPVPIVGAVALPAFAIKIMGMPQVPQKKTRSSVARRKASPSPPRRRPTIDYKRLFEGAADAMLVVDAEGNYIDANPAARSLTGYTLAELRTMRIGDLTVPEERDLSAKHFARLRATGKTRNDRVLLRKDGTQVRVEAHAVDLGGGVYQTTLRDVSRRIAAEEELRRSLEAYATLVNLCHAAVISAGPDGKVRSWNPAAEELFGYSAEEAIGMPVEALVSAEIRGRHAGAFRRRLESSAREPFRRIIAGGGIRKDGTSVPIEASLAVGRQGSEQVFNAVIRDMSEHLGVVEKLNDALQRLRFHVERMPLAYIVWDVEFRVTEWNPAAQRMFGYSKDEAIGRHAYDLIVPPDAQAAVDKVWADLLRGATPSHSVNANVRKDGSRFMCEWFNTPLRASAGEIHGVASMAQNVSEREAAESRIREAQKLESLGVLASGVAHDFNSLLMIILGNTALLRSLKGLPSRAIEQIELIEEAGSRADHLIKHLLAYARTGRHNPQPTDLNEVIRQSLTFVRSTLGKKHRLDLQLSDRVGIIAGDRNQIEQVILNLCLNARQAMTNGGAITVATRPCHLIAEQIAESVLNDAQPGEYVEMVVSDTGCGMDEATAKRIFDPFFTTKSDGHGLGLAAVLGILRQHGATAVVESRLRQGTRMHVFFPVQG